MPASFGLENGTKEYIRSVSGRPRGKAALANECPLTFADSAIGRGSLCLGASELSGMVSTSGYHRWPTRRHSTPEQRKRFKHCVDHIIRSRPLGANNTSTLFLFLLLQSVP